MDSPRVGIQAYPHGITTLYEQLPQSCDVNGTHIISPDVHGVPVSQVALSRCHAQLHFLRTVAGLRDSRALCLYWLPKGLRAFQVQESATCKSQTSLSCQICRSRMTCQNLRHKVGNLVAFPGTGAIDWNLPSSTWCMRNICIHCCTAAMLSAGGIMVVLIKALPAHA